MINYEGSIGCLQQSLRWEGTSVCRCIDIVTKTGSTYIPDCVLLDVPLSLRPRAVHAVVRYTRYRLIPEVDVSNINCYIEHVPYAKYQPYGGHVV